MDPYEKQLLEQIASETHENNKMLKGIRGHIRWTRFYSFVKLAIFIGLLTISYYQLRPYFGVIQSGYTSLVKTSHAIINLNTTLGSSTPNSKPIVIPTIDDIKGLFNKIKVPGDAP